MPKLTEVCLDRFDPAVYVIIVIQKLSCAESWQVGG